MMKDVEIEKVMDKKRLADGIQNIIDGGVELFTKSEPLTRNELNRIKVLRALGTHVNAAVTMVQQETAQIRVSIVQERLKQLGYPNGEAEKKALER